MAMPRVNPAIAGRPDLMMGRKSLTLYPGMFAISEGAGAPIEQCALAVPAGNAAWHAFGTGLAGQAGVPGLGLLRAPILGQNVVTFGLWQARAGTGGILLLSPTAYQDGQVAFRGGWLHAAPDVLLPVTADANGQAQLTLGVLPDDSLLAGLAMHAQALIVDAAAPQGVALSAGLKLLLDR